MFAPTSNTMTSVTRGGPAGGAADDAAATVATMHDTTRRMGVLTVVSHSRPERASVVEVFCSEPMNTARNVKRYPFVSEHSRRGLDLLVPGTGFGMLLRTSLKGRCVPMNKR